jgi:hypothetical protein
VDAHSSAPALIQSSLLVVINLFLGLLKATVALFREKKATVCFLLVEIHCRDELNLLV